MGTCFSSLKVSFAYLWTSQVRRDRSLEQFQAPVILQAKAVVSVECGACIHACKPISQHHQDYRSYSAEQVISLALVIP